jgi:hypothetical protein
MGKPDAPTPPNPVDTARASTSTNVGTAIANSFLQNVNQNTPDGSLRYDVTGNYSWHDPYTNTDVNIPTFTATQQLSPQQQAIQQQTNAAKMNLAGMANSQSARISQLLANNMDLSGAPGAGNSTSLQDMPWAQTAFGATTPQQSTFGDAGDITRSYGAGDFSQDRQNVQDALMARLDPSLDRERSNIEQRLADQGIRYGSDAYSNAMRDYSTQANDARLAVVGQAGQEQQRMMDMAAQRAGFENSAQQQAYEQQLGRGTFANQANAQNFQEAATRADYYNSGTAQNYQQQQGNFNAANLARQQYLNEQYAQRNQPINEINSLLSGSQIANPNFVNAPNNQIPTTDVAGLINQRFNQDMNVYQQQSQSYNTLMGGILGLGAGAMKLSDEREKDDIIKMGTVFAAKPEGGQAELPIYEYSYKRDVDGARHVGPMAQDVEKVDPHAVVNRGGRKYIRPDRVMGSILGAR